jgi:hypothetical protein
MYDQCMTYLVAANAALFSAGTVKVRLYHNPIGAVARGKSQSLVDIVPRSAMTIFTLVGRSAPTMAHATESWPAEIRFLSRIIYGSEGIN